MRTFGAGPFPKDPLGSDKCRETTRMCDLSFTKMYSPPMFRWIPYMNNRGNNKRNSRSKNRNQVSRTPEVIVNNNVRPSIRRKPRGTSRGSINLVEDAWAASLLDPWSIHGVRIPDEVIAPSSTTTLRQRFTLSPTVSSGAGGGTMYGACVSFVPTAYNCWRTQTGYDHITGAFTMGGVNSFSGYTPLLTIARSIRIVSAGIAIFSTTAMSANQGREICVYYPGNDRTAVATTTSISVPSMLTGENSKDSALNEQEVCSMIWTPSDRDNYRYHDVDSASSYTTGAAKYYYPGQFIWAADGLSSSASFEVSLVLNLEYQPLQNYSSFVLSMPSIYNVSAMERALNIVSRSTMFNTANPESIHTSTGNTEFGLSTFAGSLLSSFGGGAASVLAPVASQFGKSLAWGATSALLRGARNRAPPVFRALTGRDY